MCVLACMIFNINFIKFQWISFVCMNVTIWVGFVLTNRSRAVQGCLYIIAWVRG